MTSTPAPLDRTGERYQTFYEQTPFLDDWPLEIPLTIHPPSKDGLYTNGAGVFGAFDVNLYELWKQLRTAFPGGRWVYVLKNLQRELPLRTWALLGMDAVWRYLDAIEESAVEGSTVWQAP